VVEGVEGWEEDAEGKEDEEEDEDEESEAVEAVGDGGEVTAGHDGGSKAGRGGESNGPRKESDGQWECDGA